MTPEEKLIDNLRHFFNLTLTESSLKRIHNYLEEYNTSKKEKYQPKQYIRMYYGGNDKKTATQDELNQLLKNVCDSHKITIENFLSRSRKGELVEARREFCRTAKETFDISLDSIAEFINRTDHSTIVNLLRGKAYKLKSKLSKAV